MKSHLINTPSYLVFIGKESLRSIDGFIAKGSYGKVFILTDSSAQNFCLPQLYKDCKSLRKAFVIEIKSGERNKNIKTCELIWKKLSHYNADKNSLLINLGGGMISDIGGFVASNYKRGINYINVPTTLLAQVDASIGGKTALNLGSVKNQIGSFANPAAVFIYPAFIDTLSKRELLSGFAEIIKYALIADKKLWKKIIDTFPHKLNSKTCEELIIASVIIKNKIVKKDPKEKGLRKILNYGHTVGHALEAFYTNSKNGLLHGEAIAMGMIAETYLSNKLGLFSELQMKEVNEIILRWYNYCTLSKLNKRKIMELMIHDKKNENDQINFTLLNKIGNAVTDNYCSNKLIEESLDYLNSQLKPYRH